MKNIVTIIVTAILGAVTLAIILTIFGRMNRSVELDSSLPSAIENAVKGMTDAESYSINSLDESMADLMENLCVSLDADSDISVWIPVMDSETKLMSVQVTGDYIHPNGKAGAVECVRNVILNKVEKAESGSYSVKFFLSASDLSEDVRCYKEYTVREGDLITVPAYPSSDGKVFAGWKDANGAAADLSQAVTQDVTFYADWR